jgi:tetratricopeptide (TPR) repeat protein
VFAIDVTTDSPRLWLKTRWKALRRLRTMPARSVSKGFTTPARSVRKGFTFVAGRSRVPLVWFQSILLALAGSAFATTLPAANFSEVQQLFHSGKIDEAAEAAEAEVERGVWNRRWSELLIECRLATGRYEDALATYDEAIKRYPTSLPLRVLGIQVAHFNQLPDRAEKEKAVINRFLQTGQLRYATADTRIAAGRFFANNGIDARIILKSFYDQVLETDPMNLEALIATAELAISKGDFKVAADTVQTAKQRELDDPRLDYLLALAVQSSDPSAANAALNRCLQANPKYEPALVLMAEKQIDREDYDGAEQTIETILETNPNSPPALALRAVLAHLAGDYEQEKEWREKALAHWETNPEVDHLIGRKLSDKYRFAEGAHYQRLALTFDPDHMPATFQLAQDLLRLGEDDPGWELAEKVNEQDPYNVVAYNLMTLKDRMDGFETVRVGGEDAVAEQTSGSGEILVRMDPREKAIYGRAVADLLADAKRVLCEKYDLELDRPVIVEIFPKQSDFAIRTFGLPGGEGFLGVCFGPVITANSPASQGERPSNWESVLWHEFCHVVTLTKTNNRMPRWLSEGISVYEERLRDPRWGQSMTAAYREMLLGDDYTPVSELSAAFLNPPSPAHLQFAYYESSLVVEYLVETYGRETLNALLDALAQGVTINEALAEVVAPMERIELGFAEYARKQALEFGKDLSFERPASDEQKENPFSEDFPDVRLPGTDPNAERIAWAEEHLDNYWARMLLAGDAMQNDDFDRAIRHLEFLREQGAATGEQGGVLELLALCFREQDATEKEIAALDALFSHSPDALPFLERSIEMRMQSEDWQTVLDHARQALAIHPLRVGLHRAIVTASEELGQADQAIDSLLALQAMDPVDQAGLHYQLAQAFRADSQLEAAKQHAVDALLIAPRYRDAHRLLLALVREQEEQEAEADGKAEGSPAGEDSSEEAAETKPEGSAGEGSGGEGSAGEGSGGEGSGGEEETSTGEVPPVAEPAAEDSAGIGIMPPGFGSPLRFVPGLANAPTFRACDEAMTCVNGV